ncbi:MAG: acetyl-CoA carboxylase biotin carboxyl carrier protein, partial [Burkholderiaceae bacterium]
RSTCKDPPVGTGQLQFRDVLEMIELIKASSNFREVRLRSGELEIELRRGSASDGHAQTPQSHGAATSDVAPFREAAEAPSPEATRTTGRARAAGAPQVAARDGVHVVFAPMVGTVYHAAQPGAAPFVALGQAVAVGAQLCIIEVMKLMNSVQAGCAGVVSEILVADGQTVEHGQALFAITLH